VQGKAGPAGAPGPRGEPGPPGQLPSIEQIMPWLHLVFDAWEDYRQQRDSEAAERDAADRAVLEAVAHSDEPEDDDDDGERKKKKKKRKHRD
jgi:hypothetical protein